LLLCGLSADAETLERILAAFTNEAPAQRRASGLVRGFLLLDASNRLDLAQPIPGLLQMAPCLADEWRRRTSLMHAKVLLMGFGPSRHAAPSRWRLVVSTGNWTAETWGRQAQIDLFWSTEWRSDEGPGQNGSQALADVHAAFAFFERMLRGLYGEHLAALQGEPLAAGWLTLWRDALRLRGSARQRMPQFIHSLDQWLMPQLRQRFPAEGVAWLVAGSGFFEQGEKCSSEPPAVIRELESLGRAGNRYLVFNPSMAGSLAGWVVAQPRTTDTQRRRLGDGRIGQWTLCLPRDPLQSKPSAGRNRLHAKYVAGLARINDAETGRLVFMYLGSGNLSRRGMLSSAKLVEPGSPTRRPAGNIEAGVVLLSEQQLDHAWQRLACGDVATLEDEDGVTEGIGEDLFEPQDPPPLLFLRDAGGYLQVTRSAVPRASVWIEAVDGSWIHLAPDEQALPWPAPAPGSVRVRAVDPASTCAASAAWDVPVFSKEGLFCIRAVPQLPVASVLQALLAFPAVPPHEAEDDEAGESQSNRAAAAGGSRPVNRTEYPLRMLAAVVEGIARRNVLLTREEFPYWLTQLRLLLLEQTADADRQAIRELGVDLFDALEQPGFVPPWLQEDRLLSQQYGELIAVLRLAWCAGETQRVTDAGAS